MTQLEPAHVIIDRLASNRFFAYAVDRRGNRVRSEGAVAGPSLDSVRSEACEKWPALHIPHTYGGHRA